jgi:hypothetical protein
VAVSKDGPQYRFVIPGTSLLIQLGADCPAAENARCGADDLTPTHELSTLKADGRARLSAPREPID